MDRGLNLWGRTSLPEGRLDQKPPLTEAWGQEGACEVGPVGAYPAFLG